MIDLQNLDNMELMASYPDNYFNLAIVDPPYGIGEDGASNHSRDSRAKAKKYAIKNWDKTSSPISYFKELKRVSKNQIIWGANHFIQNIPNANSPCWIVWNKENGANDFADCELAYTSFKTALRMFKFTWSGMLQGDMKNKEPTQKPVALYKWLLKLYAKEGDKILDTHLGSGSIALACYDLNFDLVGCELDKEYFDNMMIRFEAHKLQQKLF